MPYSSGILSIERVIRPNEVTNLLSVTPDNGTKAIIFDLDVSLKREGLCEFLKECQAAKTQIRLEPNGQLTIPPTMERRFEFYKEFYGLTRAAVIGVDILQAPEEKKKEGDGEKKSGEENKEMKKLEAEPEKPKKPAKPKVSQKLEPKNLNTVPAGIMVVASKEIKGPEAKANKPSAPTPLSGRLGAQKVGLSQYGLGQAASGIKSIGGMGTSRR